MARRPGLGLSVITSAQTPALSLMRPPRDQDPDVGVIGEDLPGSLAAEDDDARVLLTLAGEGDNGAQRQASVRFFEDVNQGASGVIGAGQENLASAVNPGAGHVRLCRNPPVHRRSARILGLGHGWLTPPVDPDGARRPHTGEYGWPSWGMGPVLAWGHVIAGQDRLPRPSRTMSPVMEGDPPGGRGPGVKGVPGTEYMIIMSDHRSPWIAVRPLLPRQPGAFARHPIPRRIGQERVPKGHSSEAVLCLDGTFEGGTRSPPGVAWSRRPLNTGGDRGFRAAPRLGQPGLARRGNGIQITALSCVRVVPGTG